MGVDVSKKKATIKPFHHSKQKASKDIFTSVNVKQKPNKAVNKQTVSKKSMKNKRNILMNFLHPRLLLLFCSTKTLISSELMKPMQKSGSGTPSYFLGKTVLT